MSAERLMLVAVAIAILVPPVRIFGVTPFDLYIYGVLLSYFVERWIWVRPNAKHPQDPIQRLLTILCVIVCGGYLVNVVTAEAQTTFVASLGLRTDFLYLRLCVYGLLTLFLLYGTYTVMARVFDNDGAVRRFALVVIVAGTANAVITLIVWFLSTGGTLARYNFELPLELSPGVHVERMAIVFLLAYAIWITGGVSRVQRRGLLLAMGLIGLSIATVMVREGWVTFIFQLIILQMIYRARMSGKRKIRALTALGAIAAGATYLVVSRYDFASLINDSQSIDIRSTLWRHAADVFYTYPLFGVGYGHYVFYSTASVLVTSEEVTVASAHNGLLMVAAEMGALGLLAWAGMCWSLVRRAILARHWAIDPVVNGTVTTAAIVLATAVVLQATANSLIVPLPTERTLTQESALLWMFAGISAATLRRRLLSREIL
jgi:O-antigen ligase